MIKVGKWIAKHKVVIVIVSLLLLIPSFLGMAATRVNYDILSYLPDSLETVEGQDIMVDEFGMGAFSMVVVENMDLKDVAALKEKFQDVDHVKDVLWYDSVADLSIPVSMIPDNFKDAFFNGDATMMIALFDNTTSSDAAMEAVTDMRKIANEQCYISGMSGVVTDIPGRDADLRCDCCVPFTSGSASCDGLTGNSGIIPDQRRTCGCIQPRK